MSFKLLLVGLGNRGRMWASIVGRVAGIELSGAVDVNAAARASFGAEHADVPCFAGLGLGVGWGLRRGCGWGLRLGFRIAHARTVTAARRDLQADARNAAQSFGALSIPG